MKSDPNREAGKDLRYYHTYFSWIWLPSIEKIFHLEQCRTIEHARFTNLSFTKKVGNNEKVIEEHVEK